MAVIPLFALSLRSPFAVDIAGPAWLRFSSLCVLTHILQFDHVYSIVISR